MLANDKMEAAVKLKLGAKVKVIKWNFAKNIDEGDVGTVINSQVGTDGETYFHVFFENEDVENNHTETFMQSDVGNRIEVFEDESK